MLFAFLSYVPVLAQVDTGWVRRYDGLGSGLDLARALAVDNSGNVYVTGNSVGDVTSSDYATIKYGPNGDTLWVRRYNGPGNDDDDAHAIAVDKDGNVYVTGYSRDSVNAFDFATIKYNLEGDTLWVRRYNGPGNINDYALALALDASGNAYVTGRSVGSGTSDDYVTIKYAPNGDTLWVRRYNGPANGWDEPKALALDEIGNVYVTGSSVDSAVFYDYTTIKYALNGSTLWVRRYNGPGNYWDEPRSLAIDDSDNVYVTGFSYDTATSYDYATIKYSPSGDTLWVRRYDGPHGEAPEFSDDRAYALALDDSGNVYVTGGSTLHQGLYITPHYATVKYSPDGTIVWVKRYFGGLQATGLAVDDRKNIYITGTVYGGNSGSPDYGTIKYNSKGDTVWSRRYDGPRFDIDDATSLAIDQAENIYITGYSLGILTSFDYATIKYVTCLAKPGDANSDDKYLLSDLVTIVNYLFKSQPLPSPLCRADANGDGYVVLGDVTYLINFIFKAGSPPKKSSTCCL